jgi:alpha-galactosidase
MVVSDDRRRAVVGFYQVLNRPNPGPDRLRLRGLNPDLEYRISVWPARDDLISRANTLVRRGDGLQAAGLLFEVERQGDKTRGDFWARLFVLEAV